jgi:hypothetical protein
MLLVIVLVLVLAPPSDAAEARRESVLAWDDGEYDTIYDAIVAPDGVMLAVQFEAPPWARSVVGVSFYIMEHTGIWPGDPPDTSQAFLAHVWSPNPNAPEMPGAPAYFPVITGQGHPVDSWLQVVLPEPVDISDPALFPDGLFFVGMEWLCRSSPYIGVDFDKPLDLRSWRFNWTEWVPIEDSDAMIRAVVSDQPGTPVDTGSWGKLKALFRQRGARG